MTRAVPSARPFLLLPALLALLLRAAPALSAPATQPGNVSFSREVAPILLSRCQGCHGPDKIKGGYRLDTFDKLMTPGESEEPAVTPGKPDKSEMYKLLVTNEAEERMPKKGDPLPKADIERIRQWIEQGAAFDGRQKTASLTMLVLGQHHPEPPAVYTRPVPITALAFNPAGTELAVGGYHEVTIWSPTEGKLLRRIKNIAQQTQSIAWSKDGKQIVVAGGKPGQSGELRVFDAATGELIRPLERIPDMMLVARFSPDGAKLAAGGADNLVRIYDTSSWKRTRVIEQHADWVTDVAFSPNGSNIATASRDKSSRVFDTKTGEMEAAYLEHGEPLTAVIWSPDGKSLFTAGRDRKIHAWQLKDAKRTGQFPAFDADPLRMLLLNGTVYVTATDGKTRQFGLEKRDLIRTISEGKEWPESIAASEQAGVIAVGFHDGQIIVCKTADGEKAAEFVAAPTGEK